MALERDVVISREFHQPKVRTNEVSLLRVRDIREEGNACQLGVRDRYVWINKNLHPGVKDIKKGIMSFSL